MSHQPEKIIYSMMRVGKNHGTRQVLKDISLSYFYGAKIGVLGLNGSGKSTLLKIMAGLDTEFLGETACAPGFSIGYLEQEPLVDEDKTVLEVVQEGASETIALLKEFEEISMALGEPMSDEEMERLGRALMDLDAAIDGIKQEMGINEAVQSVRDGLDDLVDDVVRQVLDPREWDDQLRETAGVARSGGADRQPLLTKRN